MISFKGSMKSCIKCKIGQGACYETGFTCTQRALRIACLSSESEGVQDLELLWRVGR